MAALLPTAVRNTIFGGVGALAAVVASFLSSMLIVRWLGEARSGFAGSVAVILQFNTLMGTMGIGTAALKTLSESLASNDTERSHRIAGLLMLVVSGVGIFGWVAVSTGWALIVKWSQFEGNLEDARLFCFATGLSFFCGQLTSGFNTTMQAAQRYDLTALIQMESALFTALCAIFTSFLCRSLGALAIGNTIVAIFITIHAIRLSRLTMGFYPMPRWDTRSFVNLWKFGKWVYLTALSGLAFCGADRALMVTLFGSALLPVYSTTRRFYETLHQLLGSQFGHIFPSLCGSASGPETTLARVSDPFRWFIATLSFWLYGLMIVTSRPLLSFLISPNFAGRCTIPLLVFGVLGPIHAQTVPVFLFSYARGNSKINFWFHLWAGVLALTGMTILGNMCGYSFSVFGQLGIVIAIVFYIKAYDKTYSPGRGFRPWLSTMRYGGPLYAVIYITTAAGWTLSINPILMTLLSVIGLIAYFPLLLALEKRDAVGINRVTILGKAISLIGQKLPRCGTYCVRIQSWMLNQKTA